MANPVDTPIKISGLPENEIEKLRAQVNNLTATIRGIAAKLDADAGVTDTTYRSLWTDLGVATAPVTLTVL